MGVTLQHDCCQEIRRMKKDGSAYSALYCGVINLECLELEDLECLLRQFYCTRWSRFLPEKLKVSQLVKKFPHFMEPEVSLPHSQLPATCPYPGQIDPLHAPSPFLNIHFNIIFPSMPRSSKRSLSLRYPYQNPICTPSVPHSCHILLICSPE